MFITENAVTSLNRKLLTLGSGACAGGFKSSLAFECGGDDLGRQVQEVAQVLDSFVRQIPIVVTPCELLLDVATRFETLKKQPNHKCKNDTKLHKCRQSSNVRVASPAKEIRRNKYN